MPHIYTKRYKRYNYVTCITTTSNWLVSSVRTSVIHARYRGEGYPSPLPPSQYIEVVESELMGSRLFHLPPPGWGRRTGYIYITGYKYQESHGFAVIIYTNVTRTRPVRSLLLWSFRSGVFLQMLWSTQFRDVPEDSSPKESNFTLFKSPKSRRRETFF